MVYDMLVNVNVIYYVHVCEQARWARSAGNSAIENVCIIIIIIWSNTHLFKVRLTPKHNLFPSPCNMLKICIVCLWGATAAQDEESKNSLEGTSLHILFSK